MQKNKKYILLIIIAIFIIIIIFGINRLKENKNISRKTQNENDISVVQNELSGNYELYNKSGNLIQTLQDDSMVDIYKTDPSYNPNPSF